jgi:hypothetical protein
MVVSPQPAGALIDDLSELVADINRDYHIITRRIGQCDRRREARVVEQQDEMVVKLVHNRNHCFLIDTSGNRLSENRHPAD